MKDTGKIEVPEPKYLPDYDYTVWEYDDHLMVARGDVKAQNDAAVHPIYVKKTGQYGLDQAFLAEVEIDVDDIEADEVTPETVKPEDDEPQESMY